MADRVTMQDIANALGISRNTVSKAINNTGILADATREKILNKAAEMGYRQSPYFTRSINYLGISLTLPGTKREIALFTTAFLGKHAFISSVLETLQKNLSDLGCYLTIYRILDEEILGLRLPQSFDRENTAGIICFEMFHYPYSKMICDLGLPTLFVDSPACIMEEPLRADRIYMDNRTHICAIVKEMVRRGKKEIGFIGEAAHCQSFFERYMSYRNAMYLLGLPCPEKACITGNKEGIFKPTSSDYQEYLTVQLQKLDKLPEVFLCANDYVAIDVLQVLKKLDVSVPQDLWLCGFDDSLESRMISPSLTTVHIHYEIIAQAALHMLVSRINRPSLRYRTIHTETSLIYRESTEDHSDR